MRYINLRLTDLLTYLLTVICGLLSCRRPWPMIFGNDDDQKQGKACFKSAAIYESNSERIGKSVNYCRSYV